MPLENPTCPSSLLSLILALLLFLFIRLPISLFPCFFPLLLSSIHRRREQQALGGPQQALGAARLAARRMGRWRAQAWAARDAGKPGRRRSARAGVAGGGRQRRWLDAREPEASRRLGQAEAGAGR
jgi:hypothetical protein